MSTDQKGKNCTLNHHGREYSNVYINMIDDFLKYIASIAGYQGSVRWFDTDSLARCFHHLMSASRQHHHKNSQCCTEASESASKHLSLCAKYFPSLPLNCCSQAMGSPVAFSSKTEKQLPDGINDRLYCGTLVLVCRGGV